MSATPAPGKVLDAVNPIVADLSAAEAGRLLMEAEVRSALDAEVTRSRAEVDET